jgi:type IV secretory pathway VirB10-like protein
MDGTKFPGGSSGGGCRLKAGTVIIADQISATTNTNPGPVIAQVAFDVLGEDGCDGIRAGSTLVGSVEQGAQYGASRGNYVFKTLEPVGKPAIDLESAALDAMGRGGVPSEVDYHTGKIATRVAVASMVQILDAGASYFANPFLAAPTQEAGSAVNNWANQALTQAPTITTDPLKRRSRLTIILEKAIDV